MSVGIVGNFAEVAFSQASIAWSVGGCYNHLTVIAHVHGFVMYVAAN